ncbi:hypothetical protein KRX57_03105 [Weeksellaceae bacterium TAE3-ERU29]|nr:hypothetical protein [Weeksellaceae bacterium TAE3-ERU29]
MKMRYLILFYFVLSSCSLLNVKQDKKDYFLKDIVTDIRVSEIDYLGKNWYAIYAYDAKIKSKKYKIIVNRNEMEDGVFIGQVFKKAKLIPMVRLIIRGKDYTPMNYLDITCHNISGIEVCAEKENGYYQLYRVDKL